MNSPLFEIDTPPAPAHATEAYTPQDWQLEDIRKLRRKSSSANWSEMGTFKTTTGLWLIEQVAPEDSDILIITTKNGKGTYFDAIPKTLRWPFWSVGIQETVVPGLGAKVKDLGKLLKLRSGIHGRRIFIAHYDCFTNRSKIKNTLLSHQWGFVLVDEAHRLKNKDTQWTQNIKRLKVHKNGGKHIMTGTGFVNRPDEIWSLLNFLDKDEFSSYWRFRTTYCDEYMDGRGFRVITGLRQHKVEEFRKLRMSLGPRRMMAEVHASIREPIRSTRTVELNAVQRRMYNDIKSVLQALDQQGALLRSPNVLSQLNRLRQICVATPEVLNTYFDQSLGRMVTDIRLVEPSSKLDEIMRILEELDDPEQQVVIFSSFRGVLTLLEDRLDKAEIPYLHMKSEHGERTRYEIWHDLFPLKKHKVFMSTVQLGGESINLTPAQYLIFVDKPWSPKDVNQAIGRVYRPGQTKGCEVISIEAERTVDARIKNLLDIKGRWFDAIFKD